MGLMEVLNISGYIVLVAVMTWRLPTSLACDFDEAQLCPHIDLTSDDVWDFIPKEDLDSKCRKLDIALTCALKPEITTGCEPKKTVEFNASHRVLTTICDTHRYAYLQGVDCLMQEEVKNAAEMCNRKFRMKARREPCLGEAVTNARMCFREILSDFAGCTTEDSNLMGYLGDKYLRPYNDMYGCEWDDDITVGLLATPSTTAPLTTEPPTTAQSSGPTSTTTTATENIGRVKDASNRLTAASNALLGSLLFLVFLFV